MVNADLAPADDPTWKKSSWSAHNGNCVEVASLADGSIGVRDSKNPAGPVLRVRPTDWAAFLLTVKEGGCEWPVTG